MHPVKKCPHIKNDLGPSLSYRVKHVRKRNKYHVLMHICGIWKNGRDKLNSKAGIEMQRMAMWLSMGVRVGEGGTNCEISIDTFTMCKTDS